MSRTIKLEFTRVLAERLQEKNPLIQVILGPRQVGKTTGVKQVLAGLKKHFIYFSADDALSLSRDILLEQWQKAKELGEGGILVIDEIQKLPQWSETIKKLWDAQPPKKRIKCVLLGSSSLQLQKGLTESLAGRFELIRVFQWNYAESKKAFQLGLDDYLAYGGYPASYSYRDDPPRWQSYIRSSILETVIGKDILLFQQVQKPALFRQAFDLLCQYPAQEISFTKLLGQLQDKGNTDLIKRYIELFEGAFLMKALSKYSAKPFLRKSSSPKILFMCPAFHTAFSSPNVVQQPELKGRLFETAVGAELARLGGELFYWREGIFEVDYVVVFKGKLFAVEVKSGKKKNPRGLAEFLKQYPKAHPIFVHRDNFEKLSKDVELFFHEMA